MAGRIYSNPPIVEALCEFRFESGDAWDSTVPGKLQGVLQHQYDGKPSDQALLQASIESDDEGQGLSLTQRSRVMLRTEDGTRLVGVGPDLLSIHILTPYLRHDGESLAGWMEFRPRIQDALLAYWGVAMPDGVVRTGLRYLNRIRPPQLDAARYLASAPTIPSELSVRTTTSLARTEHEYDDGTNVRVVQAYDASDLEDGFLLDIDAFRTSESPLEQGTALEAVDLLHDRCSEFFEALVTDEARELFSDG